MTPEVIGLLMLALMVVAILIGFPTAFTLMSLGVFFGFMGLAAGGNSPFIVFDLVVQRTFFVMQNDVLVAIPLFLFMGYVVERANILDRLFHSIQLAAGWLPGSLAVATLATCALFATATGIVGAVVTLMGLLAFPQMLKAGYDVRLASGVICAGGCLGILIPPSVLLIVYGATAGVSVVQLYAGAFLPGFMLASLYLGCVIILAKWKPELMPPLSESEQRVPLPAYSQALSARGSNPLFVLPRALGESTPGVRGRTALGQLFVTLVPALAIAGIVFTAYRITTAPVVEASAAGLIEAGGEARTRLAEIPGAASWMQGTHLDWAFTTTPQRELFDRRIPYPRGRAVGGISRRAGPVDRPVVCGLSRLRGRVPARNALPPQQSALAGGARTRAEPAARDAADAWNPSFRHPGREPVELRSRVPVVGPPAPHPGAERPPGRDRDRSLWSRPGFVRSIRRDGGAAALHRQCGAGQWRLGEGLPVRAARDREGSARRPQGR